MQIFLTYIAAGFKVQTRQNRRILAAFVVDAGKHVIADHTHSQLNISKNKGLKLRIHFGITIE